MRGARLLLLLVVSGFLEAALLVLVRGAREESSVIVDFGLSRGALEFELKLELEPSSEAECAGNPVLLLVVSGARVAKASVASPARA